MSADILNLQNNLIILRTDLSKAETELERVKLSGD